ncbi:MAG: hypothetical protein RSG55_07210, partial [Oscillospiraceae bacterium]
GDGLRPKGAEMDEGAMDAGRWTMDGTGCCAVLVGARIARPHFFDRNTGYAGRWTMGRLRPKGAEMDDGRWTVALTGRGVGRLDGGS